MNEMLATRRCLCLLAVVATLVLRGGQAATVQQTANPIRKVVTMLQEMQKKIVAEGEKEADLFEKFQCYCTSGTADLKASIEAASGKIPQLQSQIEESGAQNAQLVQDIATAKQDRESAKAKMAEATSLRDKEAAAFAKSSAEAQANLDSMTKAVDALDNGLAGAFLQSPAAERLSRLVTHSRDDMDEDTHEALTAFLSSSSDAPGSFEIVGMLKQMKETMSSDLADSTAAEKAAVEEFSGMIAAKQKEVKALTESVETKTAQLGEGGTKLVEMKEDLDDTSKALADDQKFSADLEKNCGTKAKEWEARKLTRADELLALADTIKILNDDDALDLFKKALPAAVPAPSFVQLSSSRRSAVVHGVRKALAGSKDARLELIAMALQGKKVNFDKVVGMVDDMVVLLKKEQTDDDSKKAYCGQAFDEAEDDKKALEHKKSKLETAIAEGKESIAAIVQELKSLKAAIHELDKQVSEATELRKKENVAFQQELAQSSAAKELLGFAKNRLNKFYHPGQHKAAPKQQLSEEDRIAVNFGGTPPPTEAPGGIAGTGVEAPALVQIKAHSSLRELSGVRKAAPAPPPETFDAYATKGEESNGVIAMIDLLIKDLDKDMVEGETEEKDSQADYETFVADSAEKRKLSTEALANQESAKAAAEETLLKNVEEDKATLKEQMANAEMTAGLHQECDWLLKYFDTRKQARADEVDSLQRAKAVLSGADYSFVQLSQRHHMLRGAAL